MWNCVTMTIGTKNNKKMFWFVILVLFYVRDLFLGEPFSSFPSFQFIPWIHMSSRGRHLWPFSQFQTAPTLCDLLPMCLMARQGLWQMASVSQMEVVDILKCFCHHHRQMKEKFPPVSSYATPSSSSFSSPFNESLTGRSHYFPCKVDFHGPLFLPSQSEMERSNHTWVFLSRKIKRRKR